MRILDVSAGARAVWFDKKYPDAVFVDIRSGMSPDIVCDTKLLPFPSGIFDLIVFDPPHVSCGPNSEMSKRYGHWKAEEIRAIVRGTASETHRVTRDDALMAFKWNDHDMSLHAIFGLMYSYWRLMFGHNIAFRSLRGNSSYWAMMRRVSQ